MARIKIQNISKTGGNKIIYDIHLNPITFTPNEIKDIDADISILPNCFMIIEVEKNDADDPELKARLEHKGSTQEKRFSVKDDDESDDTVINEDKPIKKSRKDKNKEKGK